MNTTFIYKAKYKLGVLPRIFLQLRDKNNQPWDKKEREGGGSWKLVHGI